MWAYFIDGGSLQWMNEDALALVRANEDESKPPRDEFAVYQQEGFYPYPCRKLLDCCLNFETVQARELHEKDDSACRFEVDLSSPDRSVQLKHNASFEGRGTWYCRAECCLEVHSTKMGRDRHELYCSYKQGGESGEEDPIAESETLMCRDGCGRTFENDFMRRVHENECDAVPLVCRNAVCLLKFKDAKARLEHEGDRCPFGRQVWPKRLHLGRSRCENEGCGKEFWLDRTRDSHVRSCQFATTEDTGEEEKMVQ
ncbi:hypothetical protein BDV95DRAFT_586176 [Massariosphaeria phaeospora]|uniref:Uncharacterized protein n=1 Tax=Massariosphaeria phaeospora TaxID=100035 RepID=A0A7C8M2H8_9PLEO|nr:hypothetical protein BDV95DRAFT_586176 [Massariosphaeria phaeospora]